MLLGIQELPIALNLTGFKHFSGEDVNAAKKNMTYDIRDKAKDIETHF